MSKISITYDTVDKTCGVTMNGVSVENVRSVHIEKFDDEAHIEIAQFTRDDKDGVATVTRTMASSDGSLKTLENEQNLIEKAMQWLKK